MLFYPGRQVTSLCEIAYERIQGLMEAYFKLNKLINKNSGEQEKKSIIRVRIGLKKSVPRDHPLSSLGKPRDVKWQYSGQIFLSYSHTHDGFLYHYSEHKGTCCCSDVFLLSLNDLEDTWTQKVNDNKFLYDTVSVLLLKKVENHNSSTMKMTTFIKE